MAKRITSTVVLWLAVLTVLWFYRTDGAVAVIVGVSILTLRELYKLMDAAGNAPFAGLGLVFGGLITLAPWAEARHGIPAYPLVALAAVVFSIRILLERAPEKRVEALSSTLFGLVYISLLLQYLVRIVTPAAGDTVPPAGRLVLCLWVVAVAKFCDVGALLTGLAFGRHPMAPGISPKKTWEGLAGSVLTGVAGGAILLVTLLHGQVWQGLILGAAAVAAATLGDLAESMIKRDLDIKDMGSVLPGHGGVMDRIDSLLVVAPVVWLLLTVFVPRG